MKSHSLCPIHAVPLALCACLALAALEKGPEKHIEQTPAGAGYVQQPIGSYVSAMSIAPEEIIITSSNMIPFKLE